MTNSELARIFATAAHGAVGQVRKYTFEPYITHPTEVAMIVEQTPGATDNMIAAAFLHDTLEDTKVKFTDLVGIFGAEVAGLVVWLTDVSKPSDGNRATRKALDCAHIAEAPSEAQTIKVADIISNVTSILAHDEDFARVYLLEKHAQLAVLTKANPALWERANNLVINGMISLDMAGASFLTMPATDKKE
jgi:(p)ppGpp synthase/HD superfamily hydrolase